MSLSTGPKTPAKRSSRLRNEKRTPLSPSLSHGMTNLSLRSTSPVKAPSRRSKSTTKTKTVDMVVKTKLDDTTNPFISKADIPRPRTQSLSESLNYDFRAALDLSGSRSRPTTPAKSFTETGCFIVTDALRREAAGGLFTRQEAQSQMDLLKKDFVPPPRKKVTRSRSQPAIGKRDRIFPREPELVVDQADRFIANPAERDLCATLELMHLNVNSASPGYTARLIEATGLPVGKRVLAFHEAPPIAPVDPTLAEQREHVKPLLRAPGNNLMTSSGGSSSSSKIRKLPSQPERVLDAPGMVDDFYLNLINWSSLNIVAVALGESVYTWRAETGAVTHLGDVPEDTYVSSVDFSADGTFLAVGTGTGDVELWDIETSTMLRSMDGHQAQIPSLSWNGHVLSSGCGDGSIWHHDVRVARHKVMELLGHHGEVCGLKWRHDGEFLASGGNDNVVNIWDARLNYSLTDRDEDDVEVRNQAKFSKRNHNAAVKALAWCPWQSNLLASGGGTNDATIHVWNSNTGARIHSLKTPAQVTSLHFAPHKKEILSTHGYPDNAIMIHGYPSLTRIGEIKESHDSRVLFSCVGPSGDLVLTGAGDENLKFWRIWEVPKSGKHKSKSSSLSGRDVYMPIR
ncbi:WD40 repeat-like protein [Fomitiporia mediterranea MF3/22]|uniref:WD40 repeat-like protein n=1 Tax=Fomitiporia mediterranea (strain MF3/22) TaxID=694068 RepID=UPI0004409C9F|nr:WD40 repeat-like protein [Fomitiporia mediterranea MF3/22]EJD01982.1 WD40 repeat-like protein [Fomitiporia mediterranea MF3/22]